MKQNKAGHRCRYAVGGTRRHELWSSSARDPATRADPGSDERATACNDCAASAASAC